MKKYVIALDQGTTSSRAIIFDKDQNILDISQKEFTQIYPHEGWVEHNPMEIWSSQYGVLQEVLAKSNITQEEIAAIGITNQRETTIVWDKYTGEPVYNAIVWQCRRTAAIVDELKKDKEFARKAKCRKMMLTHFSPALQDPSLYIQNAKEEFENVVLGYDRLIDSLSFIE